jgi:hypothetical protein
VPVDRAFIEAWQAHGGEYRLIYRRQVKAPPVRVRAGERRQHQGRVNRPLRAGADPRAPRPNDLDRLSRRPAGASLPLIRPAGLAGRLCPRLSP